MASGSAVWDTDVPSNKTCGSSIVASSIGVTIMKESKGVSATVISELIVIFASTGPSLSHGNVSKHQVQLKIHLFLSLIWCNKLRMGRHRIN